MSPIYSDVFFSVFIYYHLFLPICTYLFIDSNSVFPTGSYLVLSLRIQSCLFLSIPNSSYLILSVPIRFHNSYVSMHLFSCLPIYASIYVSILFCLTLLHLVLSCLSDLLMS